MWDKRLVLEIAFFLSVFGFRQYSNINVKHKGPDPRLKFIGQTYGGLIQERSSFSLLPFPRSFP